MRNLATSSQPPITTMTHEEILVALKQSTGVIDSEFEVRDYEGRLVDRLPKVTVGDDGTFSDVEGVIDAPGAAQCEVNVDQEIPGVLRLSMLPIEDLRHKASAFEIWPYMIHEFDGPGGQRVTGRWQFGCYPWQPPERTIDDVGLELWNVQLPDRAGILEDAGPGLAGWTINAGTAWRDDIPRLLELGGIDPTGLIVPDNNETAAKFILWRPVEDRVIKAYDDELQKLESDWQGAEAPGGSGDKGIAKQQKTRRGLEPRIAWLKNYLGMRDVRDGDTSILQIIFDECEAAGWERLMFNWEGVPVIRPVVSDLTAVLVQHTYETGPDSIIICPVTDAIDVKDARNRGFGIPTGANTKLQPVVVTLEEVVPGHPACASNAGNRPGAYKDFTRQDDTAGSQTALREATAKDLRDKANSSRSLSFSTLLNPAHEPYDFAALKFDGDPDLADGAAFHTRRLAPDFYDHTETHQHFRTWTGA